MGYSRHDHAILTRMSKRLQVLLPDQEMSDIQRLAKREHFTVGEWVRRALREARAGRPATGAGCQVEGHSTCCQVLIPHCRRSADAEGN